MMMDSLLKADKLFYLRYLRVPRWICMHPYDRDRLESEHARAGRQSVGNEIEGMDIIVTETMTKGYFSMEDKFENHWM